MRTEQSVELEKLDESTWIYRLHHQAPPHTRLPAEHSLDAVSCRSYDRTHFDPQPSAFKLPTRRLLLPPLPFHASAMKLSSQDTAWTPPGNNNSLLLWCFPRSTDTSDSPRLMSHYGSHTKRACFSKKCDFPMCNNSSRSRGFCYSHGGGRRCRVENCNSGAVSRDLCKRHGGGRRCRIVACRSSSESGGLCYSHGGGRRCRLSWCSARAKKGGFCALHLTGDRMPSSAVAIASTDVTTAVTSTTNGLVPPNVVETLLSLANDPFDVKVDPTTTLSALSSPKYSGKNAYAIATLLN